MILIFQSTVYNDREIECCALINNNLNMYRKEMEGVLYETCMKANKYR